MEFNIAMTESMNKSLQKFLLNDIEDEEICFVNWYPAQGTLRYTALIHDIIYPLEGDRKRHSTVTALPQYLDRVKEFVRQKGGGIAMIHTHPLGVGTQGVSGPDLYYEQDVLSREIFGVTGLPLVGMTLSGNGIWSARFYPKPYKIQWCSAVRIVGKNLTMHFNPKIKPPPIPNEKLVRTTNLWGEEKQSEIMRLKIGIVGLGSVGAGVSTILARMGIGHTIILDYDKVNIHNLDRMPNATMADIGHLKIDVAHEQMLKSATNDEFTCEKYNYSIVEENGYCKALDCDVVFSCVDRPYPRQVLNHISYSCLIPVIDGGISFLVNGRRLVHGVFRAQTVGPERACMSCLGAFNPSQVQLDRDGLFDDPNYISKLEDDNPMKSRENIMPFVSSLAALETIQFTELVTNLGKRGDLGQQLYNYYSGDILPIQKDCLDGCEYVSKIALGDTAKPFIGIDKAKLRETRN